MAPTQSQPITPEHEAAVRNLFAAVPFAKILGLEIESMSSGKLSMRMPLRTELGQLLGFAHGGAIAGLIDTVASFCWRTLLPLEAKAVAIEFKINFLLPGVGEYLLAEAEMVHSGRTTGVILVRVLTAEGKQAALATATYMRIG